MSVIWGYPTNQQSSSTTVACEECKTFPALSSPLFAMQNIKKAFVWRPRVCFRQPKCALFPHPQAISGSTVEREEIKSCWLLTLSREVGLTLKNWKSNDKRTILSGLNYTHMMAFLWCCTVMAKQVYHPTPGRFYRLVVDISFLFFLFVLMILQRSELETDHPVWCVNILFFVYTKQQN